MTTKCDHEPCRCTVDGDEFCGPYCKDREADVSVPAAPEPSCGCGHPACAGQTP
jgi:hypothetical protein